MKFVEAMQALVEGKKVRVKGSKSENYLCKSRQDIFLIYKSLITEEWEIVHDPVDFGTACKLACEGTAMTRTGDGDITLISERSLLRKVCGSPPFECPISAADVTATDWVPA